MTETNWNGINLVIEWPKGSTRVGTRPDGTTYSNEMLCDYGYVPKIDAEDGEKLDVYLGPDKDAEFAYLLEQLNDNGELDETKLLLGFSSLEEARDMYLAHYDEGWEDHIGGIEEVPMSKIKIGSIHSLIESFVKNYEHEVGFYQECASLAQEKISEKLQEDGIKAVVSSRAKRPDKLKEKIEDRNQNYHYKTFGDIYDDIVDLAGVRVALYLPKDKDKVGKIINELFIEVRPVKHLPEDAWKSESGYIADHYLVRLKDEQQYNAKIEIQVASVLMHAWAEVAHDLIYKPEKGELTDSEVEILEELNSLVQEGEKQLERLQDEVEGRTGEELHFNLEKMAYPMPLDEFKNEVSKLAARVKSFVYAWLPGESVRILPGGGGSHDQFFIPSRGYPIPLPKNQYDKTYRGYAITGDVSKIVALRSSSMSKEYLKYVPDEVIQEFKKMFPGYEVEEVKTKFSSFDKIALNIPRLVQDFGPKLIKRFKDDSYSPSPADYPGSGFPEEQAKYIINLITEFDPTQNNEYTAWMVGKYTTGGIPDWEDLDNLCSTAIARYNDLKRTNNLKLEHKDIGKIPNLEDLQYIVSLYDSVEAISQNQKLKNQEAKLFADKKATLFYDDGRVKVIIPHTQEASNFFGKSTRWCTTSRNDGGEPENSQFKRYTSKGPLYIVIAGGQKFQFHFETGNYMNAMDNFISPNELAEKFPVLYDIFTPITEKVGTLVLNRNPSKALQRRKVKQDPDNIGLIFEPEEDIQLLAIREDAKTLLMIKKPTEKAKKVAIKLSPYLITRMTEDQVNDELKMLAIKCSASVFQYIKNPTEQMNLQAVQIDGELIRFIKDPSEKVKLAAVTQDGDALRYIKDPTEQMKLIAVSNSPYVISSIASPSEKIQLFAVNKDPDSLQNFPVFPTERVQLAAVSQSGLSLQWLYLKIRLGEHDPISDRVKQEAIRNEPTSIKYISDASDELKELAISLDPFVIKYINGPSESLELLAVSKNGLALTSILENKNEKEVSESVKYEAIKQKGSLIRHLNHPSESLQLLSVNQDGNNIRFIRDPKPAVQVAAVKQTKEAYDYILSPCREVKKEYNKKEASLLKKAGIPRDLHTLDTPVSKEYDAVKFILSYYQDNGIETIPWSQFQKTFQQLSQKYTKLFTEIRHNKPQVTKQDLEEYLNDNHVKDTSYRLDYTPYTDTRTSFRGVDELVIQINRGANADHILAKDPVIKNYLDMVSYRGVQSGHPVGNKTVGWLRVDFVNKDWILIDEVQSDLVNSITQAKKFVSEPNFESFVNSYTNEYVRNQVRNILSPSVFRNFKETFLQDGYTVEKLDKIKVKLVELFNNWAEYGISSLLEIARKNGIKNVALHTAETISQRDPSVEADKIKMYYDNLARSFGFKKQLVNTRGLKGNFWVRTASASLLTKGDNHEVRPNSVKVV